MLITRTWTRVAATALLGALALSGCGEGTLSAPTAAAQQNAVLSGKDFRELAKRVAKLNGEKYPKQISWVHTTQNEALKLMSDSTEEQGGDDPVYLVQATGKFKLQKTGPSGQEITGNYMLLMVPDAIGEPTAANYSLNPRDLSTLGQVESLGS